MAYSAHLDSLYRAIFVSNVDTGETKQVTDGLADAMWPAWDASGKYLWFLASTNYGLLSQWLDMTSYDREETFGLYLAVLKKGEPSPLLPESDEDGGVAAGRPPAPAGGRPAEAAAEGGAADQPAAERRVGQKPVTVQIDFDDIQQRILSVPGVPERQYSQLRAGVAGQVFYLETAAGGAAAAAQRRSSVTGSATAGPASSCPGRHEFTLSADGRKLLYRAGAGGGGARGGGGAPAGPSLFLVDADRTAPQAAAGRLSVNASDVPRPEGGVRADLQRGMAQPARLPLRAERCTEPTGRR